MFFTYAGQTVYSIILKQFLGINRVYEMHERYYRKSWPSVASAYSSRKKGKRYVHVPVCIAVQYKF